jgi:hypothetical protein
MEARLQQGHCVSEFQFSVQTAKYVCMTNHGDHQIRTATEAAAERGWSQPCVRTCQKSLNISVMGTSGGWEEEEVCELGGSLITHETRKSKRKGEAASIQCPHM